MTTREWCRWGSVRRSDAQGGFARAPGGSRARTGLPSRISAMTKRIALVLAGLALAASASAQTAPYYPDRFDWQKHTPQQEGFDAARLDDAIKFAIASDSPAPHDQAIVHQQSFGANEAFDSI